MKEIEKQFSVRFNRCLHKEFHDLYVWAYQRSVQRYSAIQQSIGVPQLFKLKYRSIIHQIIHTIIFEQVAGNQVVAKIQSLLDSLSLPEEDKLYLFQEIEMKIINLHDGNIARFQIQLSEFHKWVAQQ